MGTQWNVDNGQVIGLRYEVIETVFRLLNIKKNLQTDIFHDLRIMEKAAKIEMRKT